MVRCCLSVDEVPAAEVVVVNSVAEHEICGSQHRRGDGDDGLLRTTAVLHAQELGLKVAPLFTARGPRPLDESGLQPGRGVADSCRAAPPGTFIEARAESGPGDQVARAGRSGHVDADFGDQHARGGVAQPGIVVSRSAAPRKGARASPRWPSNRRTAPSSASIWFRCTSIMKR